MIDENANIYNGTFTGTENPLVPVGDGGRRLKQGYWERKLGKKPSEIAAGQGGLSEEILAWATRK